jgi:DNA polymerase III sliding clamp (beta) subunit (PCNA family)
MIKGKVNAEHLDALIKAVDLFRHKKDDLKMLNSFCVEIENNYLNLVATDRYKLAIGKILVENITGTLESPILVDAQALIFVTSTKKTKNSTLDIEIDEKGIVVKGAQTGAIVIPSQEYNFPKYKGLLPTEFEPTEEVNWNPQFLSDIGKAFSLIQKTLDPKNKNTYIKTKFVGKLKPAYFETNPEKELKLEAMLMPVRVRD